MKTTVIARAHGASIGLFALALPALGCGRADAAASITPQQMADALYTVLAADRATYTREVVNRLQEEEGVIRASERYRDDKALPLPAQMFRMGAEATRKSGAGFSYALLSTWPINKQNAPKTDAEKAGLRSVAETGKNYYAEEKLGGRRYFTAIYGDRAVAAACVTCHNGHQDSPRHDYRVGDIMGGVVIRIPLP